MFAHDEIQVEVTVMVGSDESSDFEEAIKRHSGKDCGAEGSISKPANGATIAQLIYRIRPFPSTLWNLGVAGTYSTVYNRWAAYRF